MNDYKDIGTPIGEMHDLIEHDPWQKSVPKPAEDDLLKRIQDRLTKEGHFEKREFVDPPDDDDPTIAAASVLTMFWRLTVHGMKLSRAISLEPSISKIGLSAKNTSGGCWIAFTGKRIATKTEAALGSYAHTVLEPCDINGQSTDSGISSLNGVSKANEYFYCVHEHRREIKACFVPVAHWNDHADVMDAAMDIDDLLDGFMTKTELPYSYRASRDMLQTKTALDRMGFRENLLFLALMNERIGE